MLQIRNAGPDDFPAVHTLMQQIHTLHTDNRPDIYVNTDPLPMKAYQAMLSDETAVLLAAEKEGNGVIGICFAGIKPQQPNPKMQPRQVLFLDCLCVHQNYRGQGVGKALMTAVKTEAKQRGAETIELMVWSFNHNAIDFYRNLNFSERSAIWEQKL